jgi:sulfoxide reductase heme-binding subunit YedZ
VRGAIRAAIYVGGLLPAAYAFYLGVVDQLGPDPVRQLEHLTGDWAIRFLIASLVVSPLRRLGGPNLLPYRRAIGLVAFFNALVHLTVYVVFDRGLDLSTVLADIIKRPYITVGMAAFVVLLALAITSNEAAIRRLGGMAWAKLHRWVYFAAIAAAAHYLMSVKSWPAQPVLYATIIAVLLGFRVVQRYLPKPGRRAVRT